MASVSKVSLRSIVYYEFLQGHPARRAAANICAAFKEDVIHHSTVSRWYQRFEAGEITFEGRRRSGRPTTLNNDDFQTALNAKPDANTLELATTLGCNHATVANHLHGLGYNKVVSTWIPHDLRESDKSCRLSTAESLFLRPHRKDFLRDIVTGDESWVLYASSTRQRQWIPRGQPPPKQSKAELHERKVLLCCLWDSQGMLYHDFLASGATVTGEVYACQLQKLANAIREKRPKRENVYLLHDNAPPAYCKSKPAEDSGSWMGGSTPSSLFARPGPI